MWTLGALRLMAITLSLLAVLGIVDRLDSGDSGGADDRASARGDATPIPTEVAIVVRRLSSPSPNVARAEGTLNGTDAISVEATADGTPVAPVTIAPTGDGSFVIEIDGLEPGPQTICLRTVCQRVFVAEATAETTEEIAARIATAIEEARALFDIARYLPDWTIEATGPNTGTGGYTVPETKTIFVSANPARTDRDFLITVLHEVGHALDESFMTPPLRDQFRSLRGHPVGLAWGSTDGVVLGDERWLNSAEDFAEVFVAWILDDYEIRTNAVAPQPTASDVSEFCELLALEGVDCSPRPS